MRWVTYLSPSGGGERSGAVDDGYVFGYPGDQSVSELLADSRGALADAFQQALAAPVEIIIEFEARLCAPLRPAVPVPARTVKERLGIAPSLVRGTDDGAVLPPGADALSAAVGAAAVFGESGRPVGYMPACLWRTPDRAPAGLSLGPAIVTREELADSALRVTAAVEDTELAGATVDKGFAWAPGARGDVVAELPAETRLLERGEELFVDGGPLGAFEIRVGSGA
ncbi:MAG: hypothetical protein M0026_21000 [Nocardiopsaceae bacterium]|nr:hypothetical protein [Nocardiopsaceae bacterium]